MTADPFAAAADLVSRSAAAYASSIPEHPADDGFFGPGSVAWRVSADLSSPVAGLRALQMQALHPLAMAGRGPAQSTGARIQSAGWPPPPPTWPP